MEGVIKRRRRLRRAAFVLALLVLAATATGVAESAAKTAIPEKLTGNGSDITGGLR
jgi:ABC-type phosphate transport system substrate-binding protein